MDNAEVDLFVIGGGSGGVRAARIASGHGARVAIAEQSRYGGTCVIRGCVPKKLFVIASRFRDAFDEAEGFGWRVEAHFDWPTLRAAKDREVGRLEAIYRRNLQASGVEVIDARAVLEDETTVHLPASDRRVRARHILIATGGRPVKPAYPGAELACTSDDLFDMPELPSSMLIEGGGFIAVEFGCLMQRLGVRVTLVYRGDRILRGFDDDLRQHVAEAMTRDGIDIVTSDTVRAIEADGAGLTVHLAGGTTRHVDRVLAATGRAPNVDGLGLERAGVATGPRGAIRVGPDSSTSRSTVWAVGDVTDRLALTPVAIREGHAFADTVFGQRPWICDHENVPAAVFGTPEIGTVGLTEQAARARHGEIDVYRTRFRPMSNVLARVPAPMLMKLVVARATQVVVGVHLCGPDAAEMIQLAGIAVNAGLTKMQFDRTVAVHPTAAEELVTLRTPS